MSIASLKERVEKNLITQSQADKITEYENNKPSQRNFQIVLAVLGVVFLGAGVIFYFASNWDYLSDMFKTIFLVSTMLVIYIIGYLVTYKTNYSRRGYAILLLGNILYGANIFLLGQIYNLGGTFYQGFGLRSLGSLILAYSMNNSLSFFLGIVCFFMWLFPRLVMEKIVFDGGVIFICSALGFLFLSLGRIHSGLYEIIGRLYRIFGLVLLYGSFLFFTHGLFYRSTNGIYEGIWVVLAIMLLGGTIKIFSYLFLEEKNTSTNLRNLVYLIHFCVLLIFFALIVNYTNPGNYMFDSYLDLRGPLWSVLVINIYFVMMVLYNAYQSAQQGQIVWLNIQMILVVLYSLIQYIWIFGELLNGGIFFISAGIILFIISFIAEKIRRWLLEKNNFLKE